MVGGRRDDDTQAIYRSEDHGLSWTVDCTIPALAGTLDPAVSVDALGNLHIVVSTPTVGLQDRMDVMHYVYTPTTQTLGAPITLIRGSKAEAAYDLVPLSGNRTLVVTAAMEPVLPIDQEGFYVLLAFEIETNGTFSTTVLQRNHWMMGDTMGGISLVAPAGLPEELYYTSHPRSFAFKGTEVKLLRATRTGVGVWTSAEPIGKYTAQFTDDKLTAIALANGQRVITQSYHLWTRSVGLQSNILYGIGTYDTEALTWGWSWVHQMATPSYDYTEPVVETDGTDVYLLYLQNHRVSGAGGFDHMGGIIANVLDLQLGSLSLFSGAWERFQFRWLRGTKMVVDTVSRWMVVGVVGDVQDEDLGGKATFFSQYNLAPTADLSPSSLLLKRGNEFLLDARGTVDPDLDSLTYTWTHDHPDTTNVHLTPFDGGRQAVLLVDKAIGPLASAFTVTLAATDGLPGHETYDTCACTIPFNAEPTITLLDTLQVIRNTTIELAATAVDADVDDLTYLWQQQSGTPVTLEGIYGSTVRVGIYRMRPNGEDVILRLIVNDGVNRPIFKDITLQVSAIPESNIDHGVLTKVFYSTPQVVEGTPYLFPATISERHASDGAWGVPIQNQLKADLIRMAVVASATGDERFVYTSIRTVQVISHDDPSVFYRSCTPPISDEMVVDSAHDELDQTYLLSSQGHIYRYTSVGPDGCSDWPDATITLRDLVTGSFSHILVGPNFTGKRIVTLYGTSGVLLLYVQEQGFEVMDTLQLNAGSGIIPANDVQFVRLDGVTGLKGGQILVGVKDASEHTLEVLVDVGKRRTICTWDRSNLMSTMITTGEILAPTNDGSLGVPEAPVLLPPSTVKDNLYELTWTQYRPDLVVGYEVWLGIDAKLPTIYSAVPSGSIRKVALPTQLGHIYHLTIRSQGPGGMSPFSDEYTLST